MSGSNNKNLRAASKKKNDEFYTQLADIENELKYYKKHFKNKIIFCNCDDPYESNFWEYFGNNFRHLGLKKLISTHYDPNGQSYKLEIYKDINGDGKIDKLDTIKTQLNENGDFRSNECVEILKEADIVITNPPFSLFREYVDQLIKYKKRFLIVGNQNAITYKEIFLLIKENKIWLGANNNQSFVFKSPYENKLEANIKFCKKKGYEGKHYIKVPGINWYTNLKHKRRNEKLILYKKYNKKDYPKYDNYNAINIDKVKDIPKDYYGFMGVPITFLDKYNPEQFKILGIMNTGEENKGIRYEKTKHGRPIVDGKEIYLRILIKRVDI